MGRYVTGGILAAIVFGTLMGAVNGEAIVEQLTQVVQGSREAVSAVPAAANTTPDSNLTPVESAGQAVQRQGDIANSLAQGANANGDGTGATTETPTAAETPLTPAPSAAGGGAPIPALW